MIRKASIKDVNNIYNLINFWSNKGRLLNRSLNYIYEHVRDFWVYEEKGVIIGCCALHVVGWQNLGEVKSLAVQKKVQGKGLGKRLVKKCLDEAKALGMEEVFALTFVGPFFKHLGFKEIDKKYLPHKIWSDCVNCIYFPNCNEEAVIFKLKK
jgi:amino-acid N-acetyltransferase